VVIIVRRKQRTGSEEESGSEAHEADFLSNTSWASVVIDAILSDGGLWVVALHEAIPTWFRILTLFDAFFWGDR
jgi:hypothetical protein